MIIGNFCDNEKLAWFGWVGSGQDYMIWRDEIEEQIYKLNTCICGTMVTSVTLFEVGVP